MVANVGVDIIFVSVIVVVVFMVDVNMVGIIFVVVVVESTIEMFVWSVCTKALIINTKFKIFHKNIYSLKKLIKKNMKL